MANENLIAYQNAVKTQNLSDITAFNQNISDIDTQIAAQQAQLESTIDDYNDQKTGYQQNVTDLEANNVLIDDVITILSAGN